MRLLISKPNPRTVALRFREQYGDQMDRKLPGDRTVGGILKALDALDEACTADQVAAAIGNKSWSHSYCAECQQYVIKAVEVGEDPSVVLCVSCARAAAALASVTIGD